MPTVKITITKNGSKETKEYEVSEERLAEIQAFLETLKAKKREAEKRLRERTRHLTIQDFTQQSKSNFTIDTTIKPDGEQQ